MVNKTGVFFYLFFFTSGAIENTGQVLQSLKLKMKKVNETSKKYNYYKEIGVTNTWT